MPPAKRRWWLALLLSIVSLGVGHVYAGAWRRGLLIVAAAYVAITLMVWAIPASIVLLIVFPLLLLAGWLWALTDSVRLCRRNPLQSLRWYQRWYSLAGTLVLLGIIGVQYEDTVLFAEHPLFSKGRSFHSPSASMAPALRQGDYFMVLTGQPPALDLQRGDIVVFENRGRTYVKRLIGLPGDRVTVQGHLVTVNDIPIRHEPAATDVCTTISYIEAWPGNRSYVVCAAPAGEYSNLTVTVPAGHAFFMGDNRVNSIDSRAWGMGPVPLESIIGKATYIYWSQDWRRIGTRLD